MPDDVVTKQECINKLFNYSDNDISIRITHVLYFSSKMYYIGIKNNKYFMCYFGHNQPCIDNISKSIEYIEDIESLDSFPSTIVPIEDIVEVMHYSVINDLATNILKDGEINTERINKIIKKESSSYLNHISIEKNENETNSFENIIKKRIIMNNSNYKLLNNLMEFYKGTDNYSIKSKNPPIDNIKDFIYQNYFKREDLMNDENKLINNLIFEEGDKRDYKDYSTLIIGHAIRIGKVNNKLFKSRYSNISENGFTNLHNSSIEMDNTWSYHNYMTLEDNKNSVDNIFKRTLGYEDINFEPLLKNNTSIKSKINAVFDDCINKINDENKLVDNIDVYTNYTLTDFNKIFDNIINNENMNDEYSQWANEGIKKFKMKESN